VDTEDGRALLRVVAPVADVVARPFAGAIAAYVGHRVPRGPDPATIQRLADAYRHDPVIAERIGRDVVAAAVDPAPAHAALGAIYDALGDPARARAAWQAAVDSSPEPELQRGLAEAIARAKDPDAAMVAAVAAAAASGDPAVVWVSVARSLEYTGEHVHALDAARSALGLGSGRTLLAAYDVAIEASRSLGRQRQIDELLAARARIAPAVPERPSDPTDAAAALSEHRQKPTAGTAARLWVAARWNPRDVAVRAALLAAIGADDPRRAVIVGELVGLASDRDPDVGRDAVAALR
jgi:tetratricopeptide (TPR) repeat protein